MKTWLFGLMSALSCGSALAATARDVHITVAESVKHHLPPLGFKLNATGTALESIPFPEKGYLAMSGPPGGPLGLIVMPLDAPDLQSFIQAHFSSDKGFEMGTGGSVKMAGAKRLTFSYIEGQSMARTLNVAVLLAPAGQRPGAVVVFGTSAGTEPISDGLRVLTHPSLARVVKSFTLDPAPK